MRVLITGSSGLIGSELAAHFDATGAAVIGLDNHIRADFFGPRGDTRWNLKRLQTSLRNYRHFDQDVRDRRALEYLFSDQGPFDLVVHCAAQPSHELAASRPFDDFDINAGGTLNLLETVRAKSSDAVFVFMSTNKVYGDAPNEIRLVEHPLRYDFANSEDYNGIAESMRIDRSKHSLFGVSKLAADVLTQEYGRYFGIRTVCLRLGCITGPYHSSVELHGFLSYLIRTQLTSGRYSIFGYKGKQVRDNLHSYDVASAVECIFRNPGSAKVYNLGGGRENSCSILEAFQQVEALTGRAMQYDYVDTPRSGDHICYISDCSLFRSDYPGWNVTRSLPDIFSELITFMTQRLQATSAGT